MGTQNLTGDWTELRVKTALEDLGLAARKPKRDVGVDLEVWHPDRPARVLNVQVKGRGRAQKNGRYRWFQVRTTPKQRTDAVKAGLAVSEAWRKKVELCPFFVLVSQKHDECWVFPATVVGEVIRLNRPKYGKRADNVQGKQVELDLDIKHEGRPLTDIFKEYRNNFEIIRDALADPIGSQATPRSDRVPALDLRAEVFAPVFARVKERGSSLLELRRLKRSGVAGWFEVEAVAALGSKVHSALDDAADLRIDDGSEQGIAMEVKAALHIDRAWLVGAGSDRAELRLFLGPEPMPHGATNSAVIACEPLPDGSGGRWWLGLVDLRTPSRRSGLAP